MYAAKALNDGIIKSPCVKYLRQVHLYSGLDLQNPFFEVFTFNGLKKNLIYSNMEVKDQVRLYEKDETILLNLPGKLVCKGDIYFQFMYDGQIAHEQLMRV